MGNDNNPVVSIIIPVYNRGELLPRTLKSVVNQTYKNLDIIVIDDSSEEDIKSIVDSFSDPRIRYLKHNENKGVPSARNTGLKVAKGEFITFLDSDDEYLPEKVEKQVKFLMSNKEIDVVYCTVFEEIRGIYHLRKIIGSGWFVLLQQIMLRREVIDRVGLFDKNFVAFEDVDYVYRLRKFFKFASIDEPLVVYHNNSGSMSKNIERQNKGRELFIRKHRDTLPRKYMSKMIYSIGKDYICSGKICEGVKSFFRAYLTYPLNQKALRKMIRYSPLLLFHILKREKKQ